jgi:hypothetical protein
MRFTSLAYAAGVRNAKSGPKPTLYKVAFTGVRLGLRESDEWKFYMD